MKKTQLQKSIENGFTIEYFFSELGKLFGLDYPSRFYHPSDVVVGIRPCIIQEHTVYEIMLPNRDKGTAIIQWEDQSNLF